MRACEITSVNILLLHQEVQPYPSERRPTLATLAWISNVSTKVLFMHLKKKKELNIWSMAEVFSLAVLHLPRVSCAFASTPGCESCAWSVNVKTFHYEAGRLFWSCPFWQLWNICPHKTFSVQSISQFSMRQSFFFFARSVFNPSMLRTTRVPEDKPIQFAPKMYIACVVTLTTQQQSCTQKYLTQNTNNTYCKADGKKNC